MLTARPRESMMKPLLLLLLGADAARAALRGALDGVGGVGAPHASCAPACGAKSYTVAGWAVDPLLDGGRTPVNVSILIDGEVVVTGLADHPRPDLVKAGVAPDPKHGFTIALPASVAAKLAATPHAPLKLSARVGGAVLPYAHTQICRCL